MTMASVNWTEPVPAAAASVGAVPSVAVIVTVRLLVVDVDPVTETMPVVVSNAIHDRAAVPASRAYATVPVLPVVVAATFTAPVVEPAWKVVPTSEVVTFRFTTRVKLAAPVSGVPDVESVAVTITLYVPAGVAAVVLTTPVDALMVRPVGSE